MSWKMGLGKLGRWFTTLRQQTWRAAHLLASSSRPPSSSRLSRHNRHHTHNHLIPYVTALPLPHTMICIPYPLVLSFINPTQLPPHPYNTSHKASPLSPLSPSSPTALPYPRPLNPSINPPTHSPGSPAQRPTTIHLILRPVQTQNPMRRAQMPCNLLLCVHDGRCVGAAVQGGSGSVR